MRPRWRLVRYAGHIIGWHTASGRQFLSDALTARAIRKSKESR